jgi:serine/threonine protein phosphatase PrpC
MIFNPLAARTDLGLIRQGNEDSALTSSQVIAVADGMGGAVGGEIASKIAIQTLASRIGVITNPEIDRDSRDDLLSQIAVEINNEISSAIEQNPDLDGMGTTLTSLVLFGNEIALLHIGDSRAYRIRNSSDEKKCEIVQISYDHTVVQELVDQGRISEKEVREHPQRSMLTQALMGRANHEPVLQILPVERDDLFLLCSDGLSGVVGDDEILKLAINGDLEVAANNLITAAHTEGAPDNVTVILARVTKGRKSESAEIAFFGAAHG